MRQILLYDGRIASIHDEHSPNIVIAIRGGMVGGKVKLGLPAKRL